MQGNAPRLDQLTSLRFFAAAMIVVLHMQVLGLFGIRTAGVAWGQGVSFFYVLSGFILLYVYPSLEADGATARFWRARIARIWPAHLATLVLGFWLLSYRWETETALANLFMVQAWIPLSKYFFSYNAVSWSISVEFLFYLAFPLLVRNFNGNWWVKLAIAGAVVLVLAVSSDLWSLPRFGSQEDGSAATLVTREGLLVNNPLPRLFEFIFGMCVALAWRKNRPSDAVWPATGRELGVIALCALSVRFTPAIANWWQHSLHGSPGLAVWFTHSGSMFAFGLLIYVMAQGRGWVSRGLAHPVLVLLGEISFSIYLIHQILLIFWRTHLTSAMPLPDSALLGAFVAILLLASYLMWVYVEMPARRLIVGRARIHGSGVMADSWRANGPLSRRALFAAVALLSAGFVVAYEVGKDRGTGTRNAEAITPDALRHYVGTNFDRLFTLRGISMQCKSDGLHVSLAWQRNATQSVPFTTAVHLIDTAGNILAQADYRQSLGMPDLAAGTITVDALVIPPGAFKEGAVALALGLYDDSARLLTIDRGPTDWAGRRLVVPVARCAQPTVH